MKAIGTHIVRMLLIILLSLNAYTQNPEPTPFQKTLHLYELIAYLEEDETDRQEMLDYAADIRERLDLDEIDDKEEAVIIQFLIETIEEYFGVKFGKVKGVQELGYAVRENAEVKEAMTRFELATNLETDLEISSAELAEHDFYDKEGDVLFRLVEKNKVIQWEIIGGETVSAELMAAIEGKSEEFNRLYSEQNLKAQNNHSTIDRASGDLAMMMSVEGMEVDEAMLAFSIAVSQAWNCADGLHKPTSEVSSYVGGRVDEELLRVARVNNCDGDGTLYQLTSGEYIFHYGNNWDNDYVLWDSEAEKWVPFYLPPFNSTYEDLQYLTEVVLINTIRYATPIEDVIILCSGEDLDGVPSSTVLAGSFLLIEVIPGGKVVRPLKRVISGGMKGAKKIFVLVNKSRVAVGEVVGGVFKPNRWLDDGGEVVEVLENQRYLDQSGKDATGTLEVVKDGGGNVGVRVFSDKILKTLKKLNSSASVNIPWKNLDD